MDGDERVRFCRECNRNVYNLSAMTEAEARALVTEREGYVCVRFFQRRDGMVLTTDCPVGRKRRFVSNTAGTLAALAAIAAGISKLACGPEIQGLAVMEGPPPLLGKVAVPEDGDE
jgi:hypothetical protein